MFQLSRKCYQLDTCYRFRIKTAQESCIFPTNFITLRLFTLSYNSRKFISILTFLFENLRLRIKIEAALLIFPEMY